MFRFPVPLEYIKRCPQEGHLIVCILLFTGSVLAAGSVLGAGSVLAAGSVLGAGSVRASGSVLGAGSVLASGSHLLP